MLIEVASSRKRKQEGCKSLEKADWMWRLHFGEMVVAKEVHAAP